MRRIFLILSLLLAFVSSQGQVLRTSPSYTPVAAAAGGCPSCCAEYEAVYDEYATPPHDTIATKWNTFVETLTTDGVWDTIDVMWVFAVHNNADALINWITPGTYTAGNVHSTAFVAHEGFTSDGVNDYLDLNWNPSTNGVYYVQNTASFGVYIRTELNSGGNEVGGNDATNGILVQSSDAGEGMYYKINQPGWRSVAGANHAMGFNIMVRQSNVTIGAYKNKLQLDWHGATTSATIPSVDMYALMINNNGTAGSHSHEQVSLVFFGGYLSQHGVNVITDAFEIAMDSNGKGIIP